MQLGDWLTIEEAAARLGCSAATIWRRAARGQLPLHRVLGRTVVRVADVDALAVPRGGGRWRRRRADGAGDAGDDDGAAGAPGGAP